MRTRRLRRNHFLSVRALSSLSRANRDHFFYAVLVRSSEPNISPARASGDHFYTFTRSNPEARPPGPGGGDHASVISPHGDATYENPRNPLSRTLRDHA